jgi:hypothetical protein
VTKLAIAHFPEFASRGVCTRKFVVALSATAKINSDSIGNKVTRLILLEFLDVSALRIGNTTSNMEAKPSTCAPATAQLPARICAMRARWRAAMRPTATSIDNNVKEQVIRSRIKRGSQRAVSRETVD